MNRLIGCSLLSACLAISGCGGGGGGGSSSPSTPDNANTVPVADAGHLQNVKTGDVVILDGSASHDADGDSLTYHWQFTAIPVASSGTLTSPTSPKPRFTADESGLYELALVVNDGQSNSEVATVSVTATKQNSAPVANAGPDRAIATGSVVNLDGRQSSDADGDPITYQWSFSSKPAGSLVSLANANSAQPAFTPDIDGEYRVTLIVNDGTVDSIADETRILASTTNSRPTANAGPDQNVITGETITLNGAASQDADGDPLGFHWAFVSKPASSTAALTGATLSAPSFIADLPGDYVLSLIVNDAREDSLTDNVTVTATKANSPPVAFAGEDQAVQTGDTVNLNGSASRDPDNDPLTYHWHLLSRPASSQSSISNPEAIAPTFIADLSGQYRIGLTVNDGKADSPLSEITVTATHPNTAPSADAGEDQSAYTGDTITLNGANSQDADDDSLSYQWRFVSYPEGSSTVLADADNIAPSFEADLAGIYIVELIVSDGEEQSAPDQVTITATKANAAPIALAGSDQTVVAGDLVNLDGSSSYDDDGDSLSYQWQFADKPSASQSVLSDTGIATPNFTADLPGKYSLQLTVSDGVASAIAQVIITATPKEYTLSYNAGPGGTLTGDTHQVVMEGSDGSPVTAAPDAGFSFSQWSDGLSTSSRTDKDIDEDLTLSAMFKTNLTKPENLTVKPGDGQLIVNWDSVDDATGYNLYYATEPGVTPSNYQDLQGGAKESYSGSPITLSGLVNGQTYHLVVTATLASAESEESQEVSGIPAIPVIPWKDSLHEGSLNIQVEGPRKATVNWPENTDSAYNLYISDTPDIELDNYAAYGATLVTDVRSGYALTSLSTRKPYYIALEENGVIVSWSRFRTAPWGVDTGVGAQAIGPDGTRYIAGGFTTIGISIGSAEAFSSGENAQPLGMPRVKGKVNAIETDGLGGWYIGGDFSSVDGKPRNNLAHINNQGVLTDWAPSINNSVSVIAADREAIYIGGTFTEINEQERPKLAAFNAYYQTSQNSWKFSGSLKNWQPVSSGASNIEIDNNYIYISSADSIYAIGRNSDSSDWSISVDGSVMDLMVHDGIVYAGGSFSSIDGKVRGKLAAIDNNGQLTNWSPDVEGTAVRCLYESGGRIYLGGNFTHIEGEARSNIASLDLNGNITPWSPTTDGEVYSISSTEDETIYLVGSFDHVNGIARPHAASVDSNGKLNDWSITLGRGHAGSNPSIRTLSTQKNAIYIGGNFSQLGLFPRNGLAAFDNEENLTEWKPSVDGLVITLTVAGDTIYFGGEFSRVDDESRNHLAAVDTAGNIMAWSPSANNRVDILKYDDGVIYIAGIFTSVNDTERNRLAALNETGSLTSWSPEINGTLVSAMETYGNRIYVGGNFTQANSQNRKYLTAFDKSGHLTSWWPIVNGQVTSLAIKEDTIYAGGRFDYAHPEDRNGLAAFGLSGSLATWNPSITNYAGFIPAAIAVGSNEIYVSGAFHEINGMKLNHCCLASFGFDGQLTNWRPKPDQYALARSIILGNGKVYLGGHFTEMGGKVRAGMAAFYEETGTILEQ